MGDDVIFWIFFILFSELPAEVFSNILGCFDNASNVFIDFRFGCSECVLIGIVCCLCVVVRLFLLLLFLWFGLLLAAVSSSEIKVIVLPVVFLQSSEYWFLAHSSFRTK